MDSSDQPIRVAALYHFCRFDTAETVAQELRAICAREGIKGTLILAPEGINGTIAGAPEAIHRLIGFLQSLAALAGIEVKYSSAETMPFLRMKVRLKKEIVTMGVAGIDPEANAGAYVAARDWNELVSDPQTVVIDTRNSYETAIGSFEGAVDPGTDSFREFPAWVEDNRQMLEGRRIAMFCTGGIRCEKATAYMKSVGFDDVHHLKGGILKYLEEVPTEQSLWHGECFVFDERVSVGPGLVPGDATLCRACRHPLTEHDRQSRHYREGISCPHCRDHRTDEDRRRYAERQRQVELATQRGDVPHIGR